MVKNSFKRKKDLPKNFKNWNTKILDYIKIKNEKKI